MKPDLATLETRYKTATEIAEAACQAEDRARKVLRDATETRRRACDNAANLRAELDKARNYHEPN